MTEQELTEARKKQEATLLRVARNLADALIVWGRERRPADQQDVIRLQTELCAVRRKDLELTE